MVVCCLLYFNKTVRSTSAAFMRGNKDHVTVLSVVACMLLLVGIFNFINIYTVIVLKRAREFGVKKVYGASSLRIFTQIYAENVCMVAVALLIIWMLIEVTAGLFASVYAIPVKSDILFFSNHFFAFCKCWRAFDYFPCHIPVCPVCDYF